MFGYRGLVGTYVVAWTITMDLAASGVTADRLDDLCGRLAEFEASVIDARTIVRVRLRVNGWHYAIGAIGLAEERVDRAALAVGFRDLSIRAVTAVRHDLHPPRSG